jgi:hypothetical protein
MVIRHVTPEIVTMSLPFARFGHLQFGGRGTLGELPTLAEPTYKAHSPVKPMGTLQLIKIQC